MKSDNSSSKKSAKAGAKPAAKPPVEAAPAASKAKAKSAIPAVPPIMLEGDKPAAPSVSGPGQRYALGPTPPPDHLSAKASTGELPQAYGTKRLDLTARDPHWLYASWDLTREQQRKYNSLAVDRHLVLKRKADPAMILNRDVIF